MITSLTHSLIHSLCVTHSLTHSLHRSLLLYNTFIDVCHGNERGGFWPGCGAGEEAGGQVRPCKRSGELAMVSE